MAPGPVANATFVQLAHAFVDVVTKAVGIGIGRTASTTHTEGIEHIAVAVTGSFGDPRTTAHPAIIQDVAITVARAIWDAASTTCATFVQLGTRAIVIGGICIVVARQGIRAARHFEASEAIAIKVVELLSV